MSWTSRRQQAESAMMMPGAVPGLVVGIVVVAAAVLVAYCHQCAEMHSKEKARHEPTIGRVVTVQVLQCH